MIFIKETNETFHYLEKIKTKIKNFFGIINVINNKEKIIYCLPIFNNRKISKQKAKRLSKRIIKRLEQNGINTIILSEYLKENSELKNNLYSENINILNGRYLFKCLCLNIINYILKLKQTSIELSEVSILVNDFNEINKEIIKDIAKKVKTLNIITNNISKWKRIESKLYEEYGILVNIYNNKRTSLLKSKIILNLDFPEELVNQYRIYTKAIIVNILGKIEIQSKKFNGININYFEIEMPEEYKINGFKDEEAYESLIYNYNYEQAQRKISKDNIQIKNLVGNRGIIFKQEF